MKVKFLRDIHPPTRTWYIIALKDSTGVVKADVLGENVRVYVSWRESPVIVKKEDVEEVRE